MNRQLSLASLIGRRLQIVTRNDAGIYGRPHPSFSQVEDPLPLNDESQDICFDSEEMCLSFTLKGNCTIAMCFVEGNEPFCTLGPSLWPILNKRMSVVIHESMSL